MTARDELVRVLGLVEGATPGPWRWSENGNILGHMPDGYDDSREVCAVYTDDEETGAPNAPAIIAAVNLIRQHGRELLGVVERAEQLQHALDAAKACIVDLAKDAARYQWLRYGDNDELVMRTYADNGNRIGGVRAFDPRFDNSFLLRNADLDAAIDAALATQPESAG